MYETSPYLNDVKGKKAWDEEWLRWHRLTEEQRKQEYMEYEKKRKAHLEKIEEVKKKEPVPPKPISDAEWMYVHTESPNSLDGVEATISWIIVMVVGTLFKDRIYIYVLATAIYLYHMNRHAIRRWKWRHGGKEEYEQKIKDACKGNK